MRNNNVIKSIFSLSFLGLLAKAFGLLREGVFAAYFGTSSQMDLFGLLTGYVTTAIAFFASSLGLAYSPDYVRSLQQEGEKASSRHFSYLLNQFIIFSSLTYFVVFIAIPTCAGFISSKLVSIERADVILFSRLIFFTIITGGCSRLFVVALNGLRKYGWMQITQLLYAIIAIVLTVLWGRKYGAIVLVLSFVLNSIIQMALLWFIYYRGERSYSSDIHVNDPNTSDAWKALIPVFLGTETYLFGLTIDRTIGLSMNIGGAVAALNYAGVLYGMINSLITSPINTVFLTEMYRQYYKTGDRGKMYYALQENMNHLAVVLIPVAFFLCVNSEDFITIILKRGAFDEQSVFLTSSAFIMYTLASPLYAFRNMFSGVHRAMHDNITPMWSGLIFLVFNYLFSRLLANGFGLFGITLGSCFAMAVSFLYQFITIRKKHAYDGRLFNETFCKVLFSSLIAIVLSVLSLHVIEVTNVYLRFMFSGIFFLLLYSLMLAVTKCKELSRIKSIVVNKN